MKWHWQDDELCDQWSMNADELRLIAGRTDPGKLGFAVLLKFFQYQGHFPVGNKEVPLEVVQFLAAQMGASPADLDAYEWAGRTAKRHRAEILSFLGIRRITAEQVQALRRWLIDELLPMDYSLEQLLDRVGDWFRERKIGPLGPSRLERLLRSALNTFESGLLERIASQLLPNTCASMDALLTSSEEADVDTVDGATDTDEQTVGFAQLRQDPGRASLDSVLQELDKLNRIRALQLPAAGLAELPPKWLEKFRLRAGAVTIWDLRRSPPTIRHGLVTAFCWQRQREIIDGLIDLLLQLIHKIGVRAETKVERELLEDIRRVHSKTHVLFRLAEAAVDQPEGVIKDVVYPVVGLQTLQDLVKEYTPRG